MPRYGCGTANEIDESIPWKNAGMVCHDRRPKVSSRVTVATTNAAATVRARASARTAESRTLIAVAAAQFAAGLAVCRTKLEHLCPICSFSDHR